MRRILVCVFGGCAGSSTRLLDDFDSLGDITDDIDHSRLLGAALSRSPIIPPAMLEGLSGDEVGQLNALMANLFLQPGEEEPRFRESVPWSHGDEEVVFFKKRRFVFKVDRVIEKSTFETVVSVQDRPQRAIKYAANCDSLDAMHPAARDHIGRMFFENIGVCSKTYFLSPAVKLRESMRGHFAVSPSQFSACVSDPRSHVRFLVYKRERSTINALVKGLSVPFAEAMRILESGIESLNAMHTEGSMAHGNINQI